jgi:integrase/recombinase XerD
VDGGPRLAASTIDRRLSTVCGYYRFAHIDGRIPSNPAQYVRRPTVQPSEGHGMDRDELAPSCSPPNASITLTPRLRCFSGSTACASRRRAGTNIEDLGFQRGHRTLRILGKGNKPAMIPLAPPAARTIDLAGGERHEGAIIYRHDGQRPRPPHPASVGAIHRQASRLGIGAPTHVARRVHHGRPRRRSPSTRCDRRRENFDRHAAYVVVAFVAGG